VAALGPNPARVPLPPGAGAGGPVRVLLASDPGISVSVDFADLPAASIAVVDRGA
jgi:hypothetical protein